MLNIEVYDETRLVGQLSRLGVNRNSSELLKDRGPEGDLARYLVRVLSDKRKALRPVSVGDRAMITRLLAVEATSPNFRSAIGVIIRAARLSALASTPLRVPPMLLLGPPGVGKTFFARAVADAIGQPIAQFSLNCVDDASALSGRSLSWKGARVGAVAQALLEGDSGSPVFLVDEFDKARKFSESDPLDVFHTLLQPENAKEFVDTFLDVPVRADHIIWLLTANDIGAMRASLLDRLLVLRVEAPTPAQRAIVFRSIYASFAAAYGIGILAEISDDVVIALGDATPRKARQLLELGLGFAADERRRVLTPDDILRADRQMNSAIPRRSAGFQAVR